MSGPGLGGDGGAAANEEAAVLYLHGGFGLWERQGLSS